VSKRLGRGVLLLASALTDSAVALLSQPVAAAALGIALGVALLFASKSSFALVGGDDPSRGIFLAGFALLGRLVVATAALFLYQRFFERGFAAFGIALAGAFVVSYTVELVRFAGLHRYARPAAGSRDGR
jgi:hypothetical protein